MMLDYQELAWADEGHEFDEFFAIPLRCCGCAGQADESVLRMTASVFV
jgi:hypothetical protein